MNRFPERNNGRKQQGQTLVFLAVFLTVFVLMTGLAIDLGLSYLTRARLTKAVDAACLNAARNYTSTDLPLAQGVANSAFSANYGSYTRDVTPPVVAVTANLDPLNPATTVLGCSATATSNTFFLRVLPSLSTASVTTVAQSRRATLVMSLVLDRSGSMNGNGGWTAAKNAIPKFLNYFDNANDYIGLVSFASTHTIDVAITGTPGNFRPAIQNKLNTLNADGATFAQGGLRDGRTENSIPQPVGNVSKVLVFLTDGHANVIDDNLSCTGYGNLNFGGYDSGTTVQFMNPANGNMLCSVPPLPTISPWTCGAPNQCFSLTFFSQSSGAPATFTRANVSADAEYRALQMATTLRTDPNPTTIYSIGVGTDTDQDFLRQMANDPASPNFDATQPIGLAIFVPSCTGSNQALCNAQVLQAYQDIAANILLRLTK